MALLKHTEKYPVDVCYMVADLKYNARHGVKICEVQQSALSMFNGDTYRNLPQERSIHKDLLQTLSSYNKNGWVMDDGMADKRMVATLAGAANWRNPKNLIDLFSDKDFKKLSKQTTKDAHDISAYSGFLYTSWSQFSVIYDFEERLPGMVVIDKSSFPFWIDKQRMTELFDQDRLLSSLKPKWGSYKKNYTKKLATKIAMDLGCDTFVIKPRGNFLGSGVIIVQKTELDESLRYIITKKGKLADSKDKAYVAWKNDPFDSFIVEEFVTSDPLKVLSLGNKTYQPTMRVAFLLVYNKRRYKVHFLGNYWKLPSLAQDEEGDFMAKNKDICKPPYYAAVDPKITEAVQHKLSKALPLFHKLMLQSSYGSEDGNVPSKNGPHISLQEVGTEQAV